jgi:restriction endonuclease S subunit
LQGSITLTLFDMAQVAIVKINELEGLTRIDSEYYQPKYLRAEKLASTQSVDLGDIAPFFKKGIFDIKADSYVETGIPFVRISNLKNGLVSNSDITYIDNETHEKENKTALKKGDLILSKTAEPRAAITYFDTCNISQDTIGLKIKDDRFVPEFINAFLNTRIGNSLMERRFQGNVQQHLSLFDAKSIKIPLLPIQFQIKIKDIWSNSYTKNEQSKSLYTKAEQLLLQELGLEDFVPQWVAGYETDHDNILEVARMDAEYFQPRYEVVEEKIRSVDHDALENLVMPLKKGVEVGSAAYTDEGIPFMRISNIGVKEIDYGSAQYISKELFDELKDKYCPKKGEVLLSKDGTPGIAYHVMDEMKTIICGGIVRLKPKELEPEYLALVLNSRIVQSQIEQEAGGALIKHWRPDQIRKTLIPILPKDKRDKINSLVKDSFSALHESRRLLEQAKREVEEIIESKTN